MREQDIARIDRLRLQALHATPCFMLFYTDYFERHRENAAVGGEYERFADAFLYAMGRIQPQIDPDELIVGKSVLPLTEAQQARWEQVRPYAESITPINGQDSHRAIDYAKLLRLGTTGYIAEIEAYEKKAGEAQKAFYACCRVCLQAVADYADRYAATARAQAESCDDAQRKQELLDIAHACSRVPRHPAQSYYEAVQATNFITHCLSMDPSRFFNILQFQLGRPDRYLLPYYEKDRAAGTLTDDRAQLLLDLLSIQINNRVCSGLSSGYMVGGRAKDGSVVSNPLTRMGMQVVDDVHLVYPAVGLCCCHDTPEEDLQLACRVLSHGRSHPALFNDDIIRQGLEEYGIPEEESYEYIHSTCVEITPVGSSNVWVASPYTNLVQLLLDVMDRDYASFDGLLSAYYARLDAHIKANFIEQNNFRLEHRDRVIKPLLSCFVYDCLEKGEDVTRGGARYNWIMPSFVGMANLVDSLVVLRSLVFDKKELTVARFADILKDNFEGNEPLRLRILNEVPKYGNDIDAVDCLFEQIVTHIVEQCKLYTPCLTGGKLIPSVFCWVMHERLGSQTGASPDGRKAGFPLGDGSGPCQGREHCGPTASILSSTKWSHKELIGGVAVNMKFSKRTFTQDSCAKMLAIIRTYLARGGFELQINVVDRDTLLAAQEQPEQYRDLVVRIGGYSDYFVKLSPNMQAEVLLRTEHDL